MQTETNGFQTLDAARVRQQEIDAEVERIRAEEEQKRAEVRFFPGPPPQFTRVDVLYGGLLGRVGKDRRKEKGSCLF